MTVEGSVLSVTVLSDVAGAEEFSLLLLLFLPHPPRADPAINAAKKRVASFLDFFRILPPLIS